MSIIQEVIHTILDTQKKFYNDIEKLKQQNLKNKSFDYTDLVSYDELTTSSLENGIFKRETNEVKKTKNGKVYYNVIRKINDKIHTVSFYYEGEDKIEKECFINCTKKEFNFLWGEK